MNAWTVILDIVLILISIVLIIAVLLQQGQRQGLGAIAGGAGGPSLARTRPRAMRPRWPKITKIGAAIFIVAAIAATIVSAHTAPGDTADITDDVVYTAEELEHDHDGDGRPRIIPRMSTPTKPRPTRPKRPRTSLPRPPRPTRLRKPPMRPRKPPRPT